MPVIWKYDGMLAQHWATPDSMKAPMVGISHRPFASLLSFSLANRINPEIIRTNPAIRNNVAGSLKQQIPIRKGHIIELCVNAQITPFFPDCMAN